MVLFFLWHISLNCIANKERKGPNTYIERNKVFAISTNIVKKINCPPFASSCNQQGFQYN